MAFNVAMLMDTKAILPFMATYMRSSGFDIKATVTIDQKNAKPIHNKNEVIPRWFPQYFSTSLSRQLGLPYSMQIGDIPGWRAHIPPALSTIDAFKKYAFPNPADAFALFKVQPGTIAASDSHLIREIIRDAFAFKGHQDRSSFGSSSIDRTKLNTTDVITGQAQNTESVFTRNLVPPNQVTDAQEKFKKTIAEVLPYLDSAQSSAIINFIRGKGRDGTEDVSQIKEAATNPSTQMAGDTLMSAPGYRTQTLLKGVAKQINMGRNLPAQYNPGQVFKQSTQRVANEQKFFKKTMMMQRRKLDSSRFD